MANSHKHSSACTHEHSHKESEHQHTEACSHAHKEHKKHQHTDACSHDYKEHKEHIHSDACSHDHKEHKEHQHSDTCSHEHKTHSHSASCSHSHSHGHSHHHGHSHGHEHTGHCYHNTEDMSAKILLISFVLISGFMLVEYWAGFTFNSLALLADAGHMLNDSFSLGLALLALTWLKRWQKPLAVVNGLSLVFIALGILWEAIERLQNPEEMIALPMVAVAVLGLVVNLIVAKIMLSADHDNANVRAAYLHVLADAAGSVVAIIAGLSAYYLGWNWVDPAASAVLSLLILRSGIAVTRYALKS